jgi:hypothetical protein
MVQLLLKFVVAAATASLISVASAQDRQKSRAQSASELLDRAVNEIRADQAKALAKFNVGEDSFQHSDLRLFCANSDGTLVSHSLRARLGENVNTWRDRTGKAYGKKMLVSAAEGSISEVEYVLMGGPVHCGRPQKLNGRIVPTGCPGIRISVPTRALFTRVSDLMCSVEFSKDDSSTISKSKRTH